MRNADATIFESLGTASSMRREPCFALPQAGDLLWADEEQPRDRKNAISTPLIPVVASVAMHALALSLVLAFGLQSELPIPHNSVASIRLRIIPPVPTQTPAAPVTPTTPAPEPEPTQQILDRPLQAQEPALTAEPPAPSPALRFSVTPPRTSQDAERDANRTQLRLPTTLDMRRIIEDISAREQASLALPECTPLQDERSLIECEETDALNFDALDHNSTYSYFNPQREISRTQRTIGILAADASAIADGVLAAGMDPIAAATLLSTLRAAAEDYSGTGNTRLERIRDEVDRADPTYEQRQRALNPR